MLYGGGAATGLPVDGGDAVCRLCMIPASAAAGLSVVVSVGLCPELDAGVCSGAASSRGD